jgi:hypothetical protein
LIDADGHQFAGHRVVRLPHPAEVVGLVGACRQAGGHAEAAGRAGRVHRHLVGHLAAVVEERDFDGHEGAVGARMV